MTRKLRLEFPGATYHVINRGNYRQNVFEAKGSAEAFERTLGETCERFGLLIHAYVIMRNHFHLAVETPQPNLSEGMKFLQGTWANRFNRYRGLVGRPFQGRYKALYVEPGAALAQVANYIPTLTRCGRRSQRWKLSTRFAGAVSGGFRSVRSDRPGCSLRPS